MIVLGIICMLLAALLHVAFLWPIGVILLVVGIVLWLLGAAGRPLGGRAHYYCARKLYAPGTAASDSQR